MARRGRGKGLEPRIPTKPAAPVKQAVTPAPAAPVVDFSKFTTNGSMLGSLPEAVIPPLQMPVAPPPVAVAPPPPPVAPAPAPVPIPQIDPAVLAQIQQQFNIPAPAPVKEVAPPPPPPVQVAPPRIEEPPKAPPVQVPLPPVIDVPPAQGFMPEPLPPIKEPVKQVAPPPPPPPVPTIDPSLYSDPQLGTPVNPPKVIPGDSGPIIANPNEPIAPPPVQVPPPVVQPAPAPPPVQVAPPVQVVPQPAPPPPPVQPPLPPAIPQIDPEILAQIQQEFNIPAAPPPPAAVAPPPPPVQVPPPTFLDEFEAPANRGGIGSLPEAPPEAIVPPPVQVPPPVVQAEPVAPPVVKPEAVVPPPVTPTVDPSLYSDPELGRGVEPGFGGTRGVSPMSPREQMGSNYVEPRDGPGQVPPGQTVDISEPTGIETMAETVGQGDYLGNTADTIQLPDGSTFDLGSLDLSGIDIGGFGNMTGGVDPSLYSDPDLGGGTRGEPLPDTRGGEPAFDPFAGVTGGLGPGGYGPEGGGFSPETEPAFNPPQGAVDEVGGANFTPEFAADPGLDFSNLDLSGLNLNLGDGFDANGFEPDFTFGGPQGGPGMGNGPGNNMGNQGNDPYNPTVNDTDNPYPFIPDGVNIDGMTPETLAGLNNFYEMYPDGFDYSGLDLTGIGGSFPGGFMGGPTGGTGTDGGSYTVDPVDPVGDLGVGDDTGDASDPIDVTTPYVVPDVRSASSFGLTGATQTMPVSANPFRRPESQQGLGSLAGGG